MILSRLPSFSFFFFFFNDTATTEIYTLSLHDALPIFLHVEERPDAREDREFAQLVREHGVVIPPLGARVERVDEGRSPDAQRSEEHTSELQSPCNLVCRLLLEKKKNNML